MAALYGTLHGDEQRSSVSSTAHKWITSTVETWDGQVRVELKADGDFYVYVEDKGGENKVAVAVGNVNAEQRHVVPLQQRVDEIYDERA